MTRQRRLSPQAIQLLRALLSRPREWRHGYDLTREVGLQSGTLYPLLIRLTEQGMLEAEWLPAAREGLPARHGYRLTSQGVAFARANVEANGQRIGKAGLAPA